jgi:PAS domain S-box-containing protein
VALDDASVRNLYSEDDYVQQKHPRSVLCLPIVKQTKLIGALYLENNLTSRAFTSNRVAVLELLASQAAISLENANLYAGLKRSEAYLAQGQTISRTGSFGRNVITGEIYWSEAAYEIFEHDRSVEPTLESVVERIHPEDRDIALQKIEFATHYRTGFDIEYRLQRPDGSVKYLHVVARALEPSSGDLEFVGAVTDVTEHKLAEEALRRSEAYLAEAQRLMHTSSWAWRVPGMEAVHISEEWYRIYGFDPNGGMPTWSELMQRIHPEDRAKWKEAIDRAIEEKSDYEVEFRLLFSDGTVKYLRALGHPVFGRSGDLIGFMGSSTDISESTRAAEALRQAQTDLAHVNRVTTMGELTASLAHEVNQPIAAAITNAYACLQWLGRNQPNLEEARAAAARILREGKLAGEIISRIRSQFKKDTLQRELVDVNEVILEMLALLRSEAMRYNISVRPGLAADLPRIMADRVQLQQVTMNLIINSIDAMKNVDGTRELTIQSKQLENEQILVSVADTGTGLPPQQAEQIFDAFFSTKSHGTGMGLRISRSIIESHGGRLWAADNSPRGATFQFILPASGVAHA